MTEELTESAIACIRLYVARYGLTAAEVRALFSAGLRAAERGRWLPRGIPADGANFPGLPRFAGEDGETINLLDDGTFLTGDGVRLRRPS